MTEHAGKAETPQNPRDIWRSKMDDRAFSEIRDMLDQGIAVKKTREQVNQGFRDVPDAFNFFSNASKVSPDFQYTHELLFRTMATLVPSAPSVLDLGAGTGRLSKLVLGRFPQSQITLLDISEKLLTEAARRLEETGAEFRTVVGDLFADDDVQLEADSFDCVVSSYALCHGRLESEYEGLYARIRNWIKPGGCFLCLDHVHGSKAELTMLGFEDWAELLRRNFPEDRVEPILKNSLIEDSPLDIPHHLSLLSKVGFERVDVLWKKGLFALYGGFGKAEETRH